MLHAKTFDQNVMRAIHFRLDELERTEGPCCMITTSDHHRIFSGGMDFKYFFVKD